MSSIKEIYQITLKSTEGTMFLPKRISAMGKVRFQLSLEIRPKKKKKKIISGERAFQAEGTTTTCLKAQQHGTITWKSEG